ncbi:MAG TPA: AI-2E family transporter [Candidatus Saccharimonadales bacterium]|nr:AI-2E family transporter [Candidatus Saccharimonadales bacterium]
MFGFRPKDKSNMVTLNIPTRMVVKTLLLVVATFIGLIAIREASHALTLIFVSIFLTLALNAPVHWIAQHVPGKRKGNRTLATGISFLVVLLLLTGFIVSIVPPLVRQTGTFIRNAPELLEQARDPDTSLGRLVDRYNLQDDIQKFSNQLSDRLGDVGSTAVNSFGRISGNVFSILTVLVMTFMMLIEGPRWIRFFRDVIPDEHHARADRLASDMYRVVKGYVNGQVVLALLAAFLILPVLLIVGVSYPAALIVVVFICGLIPLVGHTIGAIIVSAVALFTSPWAALIVLCYYILYQQIENYVVQPKIQANSTNMSPLLVFASVIIGVSFGGLLGGLVAIPVAGCLRIVLLDYLRSKKIIEPKVVQAALDPKKS